MEEYIVITKDGVDYKYKLVKDNNILDLIRSYVENNFVMIQTREYPRKQLRKELDEYIIKKLQCTTTDIQWQWVISGILKDTNRYYRKLKIRKVDRQQTLEYFFKNDPLDNRTTNIQIFQHQYQKPFPHEKTNINN